MQYEPGVWYWMLRRPRWEKLCVYCHRSSQPYRYDGRWAIWFKGAARKSFVACPPCVKEKKIHPMGHQLNLPVDV